MPEMAVGARLKLIREKNKYSLEKMSKVLAETGNPFFITGASISRYENGQRTPDNAFLEAFGIHFNLSGDWLLFGTPPIYRSADIKKGDIFETFVEFVSMLNEMPVKTSDSKKVLKVTPENLFDDTPENFVLMLQYMLKFPDVRKAMFQFFYLFQK
ncbi:MAG: helix-turn-helix domain-containing protein, partial [bacterium]|nr:helix-turn-helix domain-containing protein [bacterium]